MKSTIYHMILAVMGIAAIARIALFINALRGTSHKEP